MTHSSLQEGGNVSHLAFLWACCQLPLPVYSSKISSVRENVSGNASGSLYQPFPKACYLPFPKVSRVQPVVTVVPCHCVCQRRKPLVSSEGMHAAAAPVSCASTWHAGRSSGGTPISAAGRAWSWASPRASCRRRPLTLMTGGRRRCPRGCRPPHSRISPAHHLNGRAHLSGCSSPNSEHAICRSRMPL